MNEQKILWTKATGNREKGYRGSIECIGHRHPTPSEARAHVLGTLGARDPNFPDADLVDKIEREYR